MKFNEYSLWKLINEALRSPNHKRCFSFALKYLYDFNFAQPFCPFSPVSTRPCQNWQTNLKSYGSSREKLKHLLWLEDLKASLINCPEKNIHKHSNLGINFLAQTKILPLTQMTLGSSMYFSLSQLFT